MSRTSPILAPPLCLCLRTPSFTTRRMNIVAIVNTCAAPNDPGGLCAHPGASLEGDSTCSQIGLGMVSQVPPFPDPRPV